jgi:hypothetical protein
VGEPCRWEVFHILVYIYTYDSLHILQEYIDSYYGPPHITITTLLESNVPLLKTYHVVLYYIMLWWPCSLGMFATQCYLQMTQKFWTRFWTSGRWGNQAGQKGRHRMGGQVSVLLLNFLLAVLIDGLTTCDDEDLFMLRPQASCDPTSKLRPCGSILLTCRMVPVDLDGSSLEVAFQNGLRLTVDYFRESWPYCRLWFQKLTNCRQLRSKKKNRNCCN